MKVYVQPTLDSSGEVMLGDRIVPGLCNYSVYHNDSSTILKIELIVDSVEILPVINSMSELKSLGMNLGDICG